MFLLNPQLLNLFKLTLTWKPKSEQPLEFDMAKYTQPIAGKDNKHFLHGGELNSSSPDAEYVAFFKILIYDDGTLDSEVHLISPSDTPELKMKSRAKLLVL